MTEEQAIEKAQHPHDIISIPLTKGRVALISKIDFKKIKNIKWCAHSGGYSVGHKPGTGNGIIFMHRLIMNAKKGQEVDHINGDRLDNRRTNLRIASHKQNNWNKSKLKGNYKGVDFQKSKKTWRARIHEFHIGDFHKELWAALAYDIAAKDLEGAFARPNFPEALHG